MFIPQTEDDVEIYASGELETHNFPALVYLAKEVRALRKMGDAMAALLSKSLPCRCVEGTHGEINAHCDKCASLIDWDEARRGIEEGD